MAFLQNNKVDVLFSDIMMGNKDGFWLANKIKNINISIVFLSSHSTFAIKAFEASAMHYLLKPVLKADIVESLQRYKKYNTVEQQEQQNKIDSVMELFLNKQDYPKRVFVFNIEKTHVIDIDKLMYAKAMATYTKFIMKDGKEIISSKNLKVYDEALEKHPDIIRAHRSILVNKQYIESLSRKKHLAYIVLENGEEIEISLYKKDEILEHLKN